MVAGKQTAYEEDIHLPLIVRGPGIAAGKTVDQMVGNIDLAPTFSAMAGIAPPQFIDGRSFLPLLQGTVPTTWRSVYLVEHWAQAALKAGQATPPPDSQEPDDFDQLPPDQYGLDAPTPEPIPPGGRKARVRAIPEFHGLRGPGYVYVEYITGEKEFYDLSKDPYELNNLVSRLPRDTLQALVTRVNQLATCKADTCRAAEDQPLNVTMPSTS